MAEQSFITTQDFPKTTFGYRPKSLLPESMKTEEYCIESIDWCISQALSQMHIRKKILGWYNRFNGIRNQSDYDHITKTYGIEMPAGKIKNIPLVRPLITRLLSEVEERIFEFNAELFDSLSVTDKIKKMASNILTDVFTAIINNDDIEKKLNELQQYYERYRCEEEINAQNYLEYYLTTNGVYRLFSEGFLNKVITGEQYYQVQCHREGEDPVFEVIPPDELFYEVSNTKWVKECDWVVRVKWMSPVKIFELYGDKMKPEDRKKVESWVDLYFKQPVYKVSSPEEASLIYADSVDRVYGADLIPVYYVEFKSIRQVKFYKAPNQYVNDAPHVHIIDDEEYEKMPSSRKKLVKTGFIQDLYSGVRIGESIYINCGKVKYPLRNISRPSYVYLSINGYNRYGVIKPYSIINETKDLEDLYCVLHWHMENMFALSGTKGSFIDLTHIPNFSDNPKENIKMYMYYKKIGHAIVDRSKEGADKTFNQYPSFNDTVGQEIEYVRLAINHIEELAGRIVGVNRQQLGATEYFDGKHTMETAIRNSSMVTEYLINSHEEWVENALNDILNHARYSLKRGKKGSLIDRNGVHKTFKLDDLVFPYADWRVIITNRYPSRKNVTELKQLVIEAVKSQKAELEDIIHVFRMGSFAEIERDLKLSIAKKKAIIEEEQKRISEMQSEIAKLQYDRQRKEVEKLSAQISEIQAKIEQWRKEIELDEKLLKSKEAADIRDTEIKKKQLELEQRQVEVYAREKGLKNAEEVRNKLN